MTIEQDRLIALADNPESGIDQLINEIENNWFDRKVKLNSKTHPAIFAADLILGTTYGFLNRVDDSISKVFAAHARDITDIAKHMGDEEKIGLFGNPSSCTLVLGIQLEAFESLAKEMSVTVGKITTTYKVLLFPKDTEITFNGFTFAIENGVQIRYSESSGYQVLYDESTPNPQAPILDNVLQKDFRDTGNGKRFLTIMVPSRQLRCMVNEGITSNASSGCSGSISYGDNLYNVRAFLRPANSNVIREIPVSFDQYVFNQNRVTLAINLDTTAKTINYQIPDVYIQNGSGVGTLSIYSYVTKGEVDKDFRQVPLTEVGVNYADYRYGSGRLGPYSEGLRNSGAIAWSVADRTRGGSNPRPFSVIKESFINGQRVRNLPITENNLSGVVNNYGYDSVKSIDYITGRQYALTKELAKQTNKNFFSPMACFVGSHLTSINNLVGSGVVLDNGKRVTIPHNVLFDVSDYTTQLVSSTVKERYLGLGNEELVDLVADKTLVYTPFYYVMDTTSNQAVLRTYHLDAPTFQYQKFIQENPALGIDLSIGQIDMVHQEDGYLITVVTKSSKSYKDFDNDEVGAQMSMNIVDSVALATVPGVFFGLDQDGERIFQFKLNTKFDLDVSDILYINGMTMFGQPQISVGTPLNTLFTFIFTMAGDPRQTDTASDKKIEQSLFSSSQIAIIETSYAVNIGKRLGNLYSRIRPLVGEGQYQHYDQNIPMRYEKNVMETDPETGNLIFDAQGNTIIKHRAGDPAFNTNGTPRWAFQKGDYVLDVNGNKILVGPRELIYHFDFIGFDGAFFFSRDAYDKQFASATKESLVSEIGADMDYFDTLALDRTALFFQPRSKIGGQKVIVNSNYQKYLRQDLTFSIVYYLTQSGYKNQNLKDALIQAAPQLINNDLEGATTVSVAGLMDTLRRAAPAEVVGLKLNALAGDTTVDIISNQDALSGFCIRKLLKLTSDQLLSVQEAMEVTFMPHDRGMVAISPV